MNYKISGGQFAPNKGGQFAPNWGGQFNPNKGGQFDRFLHASTSLSRTGK
jgi:hypothetical protein